MDVGRSLVDQHVGRNREHDAVRALLLTILCKSHAGVRGEGRGAEEHRNFALCHLNHFFDDGFLLLLGQQRHLACGAKDKQLGRAVFDLAIDQGLKALEIDFVVLCERCGHCHPGAL